MSIKHSVLALLGCAALVGTSAAVSAQSLVPSKGTLVIVPGAVTKEVANDEAVVSFYAVKSHQNLETATRELLEYVGRAMQQLRQLNLPAEYETQSLGSWPQYTQRTDKAAPRLDGWEVRQSITAKITDVNEAARVVQAVAERFAFNGVQFRLSAKTTRSVQTLLTQDAIDLVRQKADVTAKALGCEGDCVKIEQLDFGSVGQRYGQVYDNAVMLKRAGSSGSSMPMPSLDPGRTTVTQSVTAHVRIR